MVKCGELKMEYIFAFNGVAFAFISGFGFGFAIKSKDVVTKLKERGWKIEPPDIEDEVKR